MSIPSSVFRIPPCFVHHGILQMLICPFTFLPSTFLSTHLATLLAKIKCLKEVGGRGLERCSLESRATVTLSNAEGKMRTGRVEFKSVGSYGCGKRRGGGGGIG